MNPLHGISGPSLTRRRFLYWAGALALPAWTKAEAGSSPWLTNAPEPPQVFLTDADQVSYSLQDLLADRPAALGFFFTRCTTVCPVQTTLFRQAQQLLQRRHQPGLLLSITLDPIHDDGLAIRAYAERFRASLGLDRQWLMLTGASQDIEQVRQRFERTSGRPQEHANAIWIGSARRRRWMRQDGSVSAQKIVDWMAASRT